jgi:3-hydroxybutyryl-CoA dehydrogenase
MSSILLIGNPDLFPPFLESMPAGHTPTMIDSNAIADAQADRMDGAPAYLDFDVIVDLTIDRAVKERLLASLAGTLGPDTLCVVNALTITATDAASRLGTGRVIGIGYIPHNFTGATLLEAAPALGMPKEQAGEALGLLRELAGKEIEVVNDRVALVAARTLAMIINEGAFALMEGVAAAADIDTAMKLGTNYPEGPLRWADMIGPRIIVDILDALYDEYKEERYRPCVLLKQMARGGVGFYEEG